MGINVSTPEYLEKTHALLDKSRKIRNDTNKREYTKNLKAGGFWIDLDTPTSSLNPTGTIVKEFIRQLNLPHHDTYLIIGIISEMYDKELLYFNNNKSDALEQIEELNNALAEAQQTIINLQEELGPLKEKFNNTPNNSS